MSSNRELIREYHQYKSDNNVSSFHDSNLDSSSNESNSNFFHRHVDNDEVLSSMIPERDLSSQQIENKLQLQHHEREQHLHQLQSINNMLLDSTPTTLGSSPSSYGSSKFSSNELLSSSAKSSTSFDDVSVSGLFGLKNLKNFEFPQGSSLVDIINGQKDQAGQNFYESNSYRNYNQHQDNTTGYFSNSISSEQQDSAYYSSLSNMDVPSSPNSVHTPATPSTPGSSYSSNPYSAYSSLNSSPYVSNSSVSNGYNNKQYSRSPLRSPCYGRPIRGSPPYSDCSSPSVEYPSHTFGCNGGSRSNSPADSENSSNDVDNSLSDIMSYLSFNGGQHNRYHSSNQNNFSEAEKYFQNSKEAAKTQALQRLRKLYLLNSHQQQQQQIQSPMNHYHHYHNHGHSRTPSVQQQHNNNNNNHCNISTYGSDKCCIGSPRNAPLGSSTPTSLDKAARCHRSAAAVSDANFTWSGTLPQRTQKPIGYSPKVFVGGLPWDMTEPILIATFKQFGQIKIEWPGKDQATSQPKGYVYIIFESEKQVKSLLANCTHDFTNGGSYYYKVSSKRMKGKDVQIIPWALNDSNYVKSSSQKLDASKTVFVGALHGMMTATGIAKIMNDLFDNVIYVGIDTCKYKYPIGSCRVTFSSRQAYLKAIKAAFIHVRTPKFDKKIQCDPYLEEAPCSSCNVQQGPYFCREMTCFKYYCHTCWQWVHNNESMNWHNPMSRGLKSNHVIGLTPNPGSVRPSNLLCY